MKTNNNRSKKLNMRFISALVLVSLAVMAPSLILQEQSFGQQQTNNTAASTSTAASNQSAAASSSANVTAAERPWISVKTLSGKCRP